MPESITHVGNQGRLFQRFMIVGLGVLIVMFVFWLYADQDIIAVQSPYDDEWFLHKGETTYWFDDDPYSPVASFLKEPPYPLFVAATFRLGMPLFLAHIGLYLAAAAVLSWSLVYRQTAAWVGLVVFAALSLHPLPYYIFRRSVHDGIYTSLLLLSAASLLWQFKRSGETGRWLRWLATGIAFGLLWNTRQERPLALVLLGVVWLAGIIAELNRGRGLLSALRGWLVEWIPPVAVVAGITLSFMGANYARWGVFASTDMSAPNFRRAYGALLRIKPDQSLPNVSITRDMRERAYEVSPSFRQLKPFLEGEVWERRSQAWQTLQDIPPLEYSGGWFVLGLRDAVESAGLCPTAVEAEAYYGRVADEINAAIAQGLPTQWVPPIGAWSVHPDFAVYRSQLWPSWRGVWFSTMAYPGNLFPQSDDEVPPETRHLYDQVARRRAYVTPYADNSTRTKLRNWIWIQHTRYSELVFASAFVIAAIVLILPWAAVGAGVYLLPALMFGAYGLARTVTFVVLDASMFPGTEMRYLLPGAVSFTVVSTWLCADGIRRIAGRLLGRFRDKAVPVWVARPESSTGVNRAAAPSTPFADSGRATPKPGFGFARIVMAICLVLIAGALFIQWDDQKRRPPDTHEFCGVLHAGSEKISGWARLKENPETPADVEIYFDGKLAATVLADKLDETLEPQRVGTGKHGFSMDTPAALKDGKQHIITAKIKGTNYVLWNSPLGVNFPPPEQ